MVSIVSYQLYHPYPRRHQLQHNELKMVVLSVQSPIMVTSSSLLQTVMRKKNIRTENKIYIIHNFHIK